ncbi:hypothetical protein QQS21_009986 [Conoideocrella luteorostrata]|uniref:Trichodiene oxygenase n=1 Tax=Conoideocrella luteorostrata TaxID=1105319 RepID=A0AAJ0CFX4_9HYPO|nr:hypothetical protein QQS21_009986 [Conoideocrella luteorostrata]
MEVLQILSWPYIAGAVVAYLVGLVFYRLVSHPLAGFPGPRLAAVTRYYEAYYDVVCHGQYTFKIAELHRKYGPIVRISPYELHVNDPAFFEKLYGQEGRFNKYAWTYDAFSTQDSVFCTIEHDDHRRRRAPLNPFFSKANVNRRQEIVQRAAAKLCQRISEFSGSSRTINLSHAVSAFTLDVGSEFILAKSYNNLDVQDFNAAMTGVSESFGSIWRVTKHVRWIGPFMKSLPLSFIERISDDGTKAFMGFLKDTLAIVTEAVNAASSSEESKAPKSLVHDILNSSLPPAEKTISRLNDEISNITGASFETTANTLRLVLYYVYSDAQILWRLRSEIATAKQSSCVANAVDMNVSALEQLPYLTAVLMEGLRLSPGIATRMARVAPKQILVYDKWQIPAGTPVGMTSLLIHMDEELYPEPKKFEPDRWMDKEVRMRANKTYSPFSRGTRVCLGMHLAWAELYLVIAALVDQFDFEFDGAGPEDVVCASDQFIVGRKNLSGIKAKVTQRKG